MKYIPFQQIARYTRHIHAISRYRFTRNELSPIRFIIFGRGRSGSTVLVSLLNSLPKLHCDGEILNQHVLFPYSHILAKCSNAKTEVYGFKLLSYQIRDVQPIKNHETFIKCLYNKKFKIIYLKRQNLVHHAVSNIRARMYGFHKKKHEKLKDEKITIDLDNLLKWIQGSEKTNSYEKLLLKGIRHLSLTYEKHLSDAENHQATVNLVCDFLGIEPSEAFTEFCKVSPENLRDSVANYDELVSFLKDTPYAKFL